MLLGPGALAMSSSCLSSVMFSSIECAIVTDHSVTVHLFLQGSIVAVVVSGVANRLLYKMAITPLSNYVFFMAQLQTFGYCAVYFTILLMRYRHVLLFFCGTVFPVGSAA